jgi:hypothetical protein
MVALPTFQEVLAAAVADIIEHGFDSAERIERWTRELRAAAERSLISPISLEQQLRDALAATYRRMVDQGGLFKYSPGVERFTLEKVKPALRSELDRRIAASANLIKLNRTEAIEKTLRRFQGWSTSIPPGGVSAETRKDVKANVRKSLAQLPFAERRVIIDQSHKLTAALSEILASDGGAIACEWRSNYRQPGYDARPDHIERDGKFYLVRDSWAHRAGLVKKNRDGYYDEHEAVGQLPFCRCYAIWKYALSALPDDMLTAKGKAALASAQGQEEVRTARTGRADAVGDDLNVRERAVLEEAQRLDRLGYLKWLVGILSLHDRSLWHAQYDNETGEIELQSKFAREPIGEQIHIMLHEAGHRGQDVDATTYERFKRLHLNKLSSFLDMANQAHLADFRRSKKVDSIAAEVFAESYSRFCLGMKMPDELIEFWRARAEERPGVGYGAIRRRLDALREQFGV